MQEGRRKKDLWGWESSIKRSCGGLSFWLPRRVWWLVVRVGRCVRVKAEEAEAKWQRRNSEDG